MMICIIPAEYLSSSSYESDALSLLDHRYGFGLHSLEFWVGWLVVDLAMGRWMGMYFTHTDDTKTRSLYI